MAITPIYQKLLTEVNILNTLIKNLSSSNSCIVYLFRINKRHQDLDCRFKAEEIKLYLENPWVNSIER